MYTSDLYSLMMGQHRYCLLSICLKRIWNVLWSIIVLGDFLIEGQSTLRDKWQLFYILRISIMEGLILHILSHFNLYIVFYTYYPSILSVF